MEKVGVLVVSYGARETAMVDAFARSPNHKVELYIADKQRNPFNVEKAAEHIVIPDLNTEEICKFAEKHKDNIDFAIVGPEKPIIAGVRDQMEKRTGIQVICPKQEYAIEVSKVQQRLLFEEIAPEANPRFKIFNPEDYNGTSEVESAVYGWLDQLENQAVVKPDKPTAGKGVGVWGDHFNTREQLFEPVRHRDYRRENRRRRIQLPSIMRRQTLRPATGHKRLQARLRRRQRTQHRRHGLLQELR
jgi:phosphoribosylamine-glycine ligase